MDVVEILGQQPDWFCGSRVRNPDKVGAPHALFKL